MFSPVRLFRETAIWLVAVALPVQGLLPGAADCGCGGRHESKAQAAPCACCGRADVEVRPAMHSCCEAEAPAAQDAVQWSKTCRCNGHSETAQPGRVLINPWGHGLDLIVPAASDSLEASRMARLLMAQCRPSLVLSAVELCSLQCTFQC